MFQDGSGNFVEQLDVTTNNAGLAFVHFRAGKLTSDPANRVEQLYINLQETDQYPTRCGIYQVNAQSQGLTLDDFQWVLAKPGPPVTLDEVQPPSGAGYVLQVLGPIEVKVSDTFGNPVANEILSFVKTTGTFGEISHGVIQLEELNAYLDANPWPMTDQVLDMLRTELEVYSNSEGSAVAYPALGDTPGLVEFEIRSNHAAPMRFSVNTLPLDEVALLSCESRYTIAGAFIEAYTSSETVPRPASCQVRFVYIDQQGNTRVVNITDASVSFTFPGGVIRSFTAANDFQRYTVSWPQLPAAPGKYLYTVQAQGVVKLPDEDRSVLILGAGNGPPIWVLHLSVESNSQDPFLVPKHGSNCYWAKVTGELQPREYLVRNNNQLFTPLLPFLDF